MENSQIDMDFFKHLLYRLSVSAHADHHTAYIGSWLKVLKNDKCAIFTTAVHAQRAVDFFNGLVFQGQFTYFLHC